MAVYLDESMIGEDTQINYPHLLLCMGVTCQMTDGWLIGCHFDTPSSEEQNLAEMSRRIAAYTALTRGVVRPCNLYCIGNLKAHNRHANKNS